MMARGAAAPWTRAGWGVRAGFFLVGLLFGTWAGWLPVVKSARGWDERELTWVLAGINLGALVGLRAGAWVTARFGSRPVLRAGLPLFAVSMTVLAAAGGGWAMVGAAAAFGAANSVVDVGLNAHGVVIERHAKARKMSGLHAMNNLGVIAGSSTSAAVIATGADYRPHFLVLAVLAGALGWVSTRNLLPAAEDRAPARPAGSSAASRARAGAWNRAVLGLGSLAFCVALAEGAINDWAGVYLHEETGAPAHLAALGFAGFAGAMFAGRLAGDRISTLIGPRRAFQAGCLTAAIALAGLLLAGGPGAGVVGFILVGFGLSFTLPLVLSTVGRAGGHHATRAIANASTIGYFGFFTGPTLIGLLATHTSLGAALLLPPTLLLIAAAISPWMFRAGQHSAVQPPQTHHHGVEKPKAGL